MPERFWSKVAPCPMSGCWLWAGRCTWDGYGALEVKGRHHSAHRLAYSVLRGPIAKGMHTDHLCRVRCCVNPDHLEVVTPRVNILRGEGRAAINATRTHCPKGHPYDTENTIWRNESGRWVGRHCKACKAAYRERRRQAKVALVG